MKNPSFLIRFLIFFIPLMIFFFLMYAAGITNNMFVTILLSLAVVWMVQACYKTYLRKAQEKKPSRKA